MFSAQKTQFFAAIGFGTPKSKILEVEGKTVKIFNFDVYEIENFVTAKNSIFRMHVKIHRIFECYVFPEPQKY